MLKSASKEPAFDANLLLASHLRMQQAQAEQLARNDRLEKVIGQLVAVIKQKGPGASRPSLESATPSSSVTQQVNGSASFSLG